VAGCRPGDRRRGWGQFGVDAGGVGVVVVVVGNVPGGLPGGAAGGVVVGAVVAGVVVAGAVLTGAVEVGAVVVGSAVVPAAGVAPGAVAPGVAPTGAGAAAGALPPFATRTPRAFIHWSNSSAVMRLPFWFMSNRHGVLSNCVCGL